MKFKKEYLGLDGFYWWFGVVENRQDPLQLGRCQVRIFATHTDDLSDIPSEDLPWAHPIHAVNNNMFSTPKEGEYVFGFFVDGKLSQYPVIVGVVPGIPSVSSDPNKGFADLRTVEEIDAAPKRPAAVEIASDGSGATITEYTAQEELEGLRYPSEFQLGSPTNSNLARNSDINTTVFGVKRNNLVSVTGAAETEWNEPETSYGAQYPYNKVMESESGHVMEFDDTPGAERVHIAHRSGSFSEWFPSGSKVEKIVKNNYRIVMSDDHLYVAGRVNITIDSDANIKVVGDVNLDALNDVNFNVAGNMNLNVGEVLSIKAGSIVMESLDGISGITTGDVSFDAVNINLNNGNASTTDLGDPLDRGTPNDPPAFFEQTPTIQIPQEVLDDINSQVDRYIENPDGFYNQDAADGDVKPNYAGTPETEGFGESLINSINSDIDDGSDLKAWLDEQLTKTEEEGYWLETGMGGGRSNPNITGIWKDIGFGTKAPWNTDQTAWCMGFINYGLKQNGYRFVQTARAFDIRDRAEDYNATRILNPKEAQPGDIAIWKYSHVSFVYENNNGALTFVGGNQTPRSEFAKNNNPSQGDVSKSWVNGYSDPGNGSLIGIYRPSKS